MARVTVYQSQVNPTLPTDARQRGADYGPGVAATALTEAGKGLGQYAEQVDKIEDVNATVEANRLAVEHSELTRQIGRKVKETFGEDAATVADQGAAELDEATKKVLASASPRARLKLEQELGQRVVVAKDGFLDHGFNEKVKAFESSSKARITRIGEDAADEPDENRGFTMLTEAASVIQQQADFFGKDADWVREEKRKVASGFYRSRALKMANGPNGSALAAIEYATAHRAGMTDDDYDAVISAYNDSALTERATSEIYGTPAPSATVVERDPLAPLPDGEPPRQLDPKAFFHAFTVRHEGSKYVTDSNGFGVKYGINEQYNPGVDVKNLTEAQAAEIFRKKYYEKCGADKLPPALAAVHVDTFYLNETEATRILKECGGDVDRYVALRNQFLNGLVAKNPGKYGKYQKGWQNRTNALAEFADRQGGDGRAPVINITPTTDLSNFEAQTMARTDIGLALKTKMISLAKGRRADLIQEKNLVESDAADKLTTAITGLGDSFTDVKQLPQDAWLKASPQTRLTLTTAAQNNVEKKPLSLQVEANIAYVQQTRPTDFLKPAVQQKLLKQGVSPKRLAELVKQGGAAQGILDSAKPAPVSPGQMESALKTVFQARGLPNLWGIDNEKGMKPEDKKAETTADAQERLKLMGYLNGQARTWAINNPGKTASDEQVNQWIGHALRKAASGRMVYQTSTLDIYNSMNPTVRSSLIQILTRKLRRTPHQDEVAQAYQEAVALGVVGKR